MNETITNRDYKTIISHIPMKDKVILKATREVSPISIENATDHTNKAIFRDIQPKIEVVAYGRETELVEIGDVVTLSFTATIEYIDVKENTNDFYKVKKEWEVLPKEEKELFIRTKNKLVINEYFVVPFYAITTIERK